jgi:3-oxoadipate enol-lactonase
VKSEKTASLGYETITTAGAGAPWIAMVHGVSQNRRLFERQVEAFAATFRLLLIDLPGHGLSSDVPGPYGLTQFAAGIADVLKTEAVDRCHFWGTHTGAGAGLVLACDRSELFRSLILEGPVFPGRPLPAVSEVLSRVSKALESDGIEAARQLWWQIGPWFSVMHARPQECRAAGQRALIDEFMGAPWRQANLVAQPVTNIDQQLAGLEIPVLIINGEHDVAGFVSSAKALAALIPHCRRVTIDDAGGFPLWEFPERVNDVVRRFLFTV